MLTKEVLWMLNQNPLSLLAAVDVEDFNWSILTVKFKKNNRQLRRRRKRSKTQASPTGLSIPRQNWFVRLRMFLLVPSVKLVRIKLFTVCWVEQLLEEIDHLSQSLLMPPRLLRPGGWSQYLYLRPYGSRQTVQFKADNWKTKRRCRYKRLGAQILCVSIQSFYRQIQKIAQCL